MVSLGQKLKMPKTCEKPFYKNIKVVVCKKPLEKTPNIQEMRQVWKCKGPSCKGYRGYRPWKGHAKAIAFAKNGQFGSKIKNAKNMRKTILQ